MSIERNRAAIKQAIVAGLTMAAIFLAGFWLLAPPASAQTKSGGTGPQPPATATFTATPAPGCNTSYNYFFIPSAAATIEPAIYDIGNHCDNCTTAISLPFPAKLYDQYFTSANVSSNGNLQFLSNDPTGSNHCLPYAGFNFAIVPLWDNLDTTAPGNGVFTSVTGVAPNRVFNIEWRAWSSSGNGQVNPEIRLFENISNGDFEIVYGIFATPNNSSTVGVQRDTGSQSTVYVCNGGSGQISSGLRLAGQFICGTPTATATSTRTSTPSITPTGTLPTVTRTPTVTQTGTNTRTPTITATGVPSNTPTNTFTGTPTNTFTSTPTNTYTPTDTFTGTPTNTFTSTSTNTPTHTPTYTFTPTHTSTSTSTSTSTDTPIHGDLQLNKRLLPPIYMLQVISLASRYQL